MSRFIPELSAQDNEEGIRSLFGHLFAIRFVAGLVVASVYFFSMSLALEEIPTAAVATFSFTIILAAATDAVYSLFLGLNRSARWGLCTLGRRSMMVLVVPLGFYLGGIRGSATGMLAQEILVLAVGIFWARSYFCWKALRVDWSYLRPMMQFGILFFAAAMFHNALRYSGEATVRVFAGDYAEVAQFAVSLNLIDAGLSAVFQFIFIFTPYLSALKSTGDDEKIRRWIEHLQNGLTVAMVTVVFGAAFIADEVVLLLIGNAYAPAAKNLFPLAVSLVLMVSMGVAGLMTLIEKRPSLAIEANASRLILFWLFCVPLVPRYGSWGASIALLVATTLATAWFVWRMRTIRFFSLRKCSWAIGLAAPFLLLRIGSSDGARDIVLFLVATGGYLLLVFRFHIVRTSELREIALRVFSR